MFWDKCFCVYDLVTPRKVILETIVFLKASLLKTTKNVQIIYRISEWKKIKFEGIHKH